MSYNLPGGLIASKKRVCYTVAMFIFGNGNGAEQEEQNMSLQFIMGNSGAGKSRYAYEKTPGGSDAPSGKKLI